MTAVNFPLVLSLDKERYRHFRLFCEGCNAETDDASMHIEIKMYNDSAGTGPYGGYQYYDFNIGTHGWHYYSIYDIEILRVSEDLRTALAWQTPWGIHTTNVSGLTCLPYAQESYNYIRGGN